MSGRNIAKIAKFCIEPLPVSLKSILADAARPIIRNHIEKLKTPTSIVLFLTNKCNLSCSHCFYWDNLNNGKQELTLEQIDKIVRSFKDADAITLSGGEVFLRGDLLDICKLLHTKFKRLRIATNGYLTNKIIETTKKIIDGCSFSEVRIQISLDGIRSDHDRIRRSPRSFDNAIQTITTLKELEKNRKNFSVEINVSISQENIQNVLGFAKDLSPLQVPIKFNPVRGQDFGVYNLDKSIANAINPKEQVFVSLEQLESLYFQLNQLNDNSKNIFWKELDKLTFRYTIDTIKHEKRMIGCHAGKVDGVIYENGDVSLCEFTKPIGNLRETDYDFHALWNCQKANEMRQKTRKCACIHGCNLASSLAHEPEVILGITRA